MRWPRRPGAACWSVRGPPGIDRRGALSAPVAAAAAPPAARLPVLSAAALATAAPAAAAGVTAGRRSWRDSRPPLLA